MPSWMSHTYWLFEDDDVSINDSTDDCLYSLLFFHISCWDGLALWKTVLRGILKTDGCESWNKEGYPTVLLPIDKGDRRQAVLTHRMTLSNRIQMFSWIKRHSKNTGHGRESGKFRTPGRKFFSMDSVVEWKINVCFVCQAVSYTQLQNPWTLWSDELAIDMLMRRS